MSLCTQDCSISTGVCKPGESYPGVWEFPLWSCQQDDGTALASMDPQGDMFEVYKREFDSRYQGRQRSCFLKNGTWPESLPPSFEAALAGTWLWATACVLS